MFKYRLQSDSSTTRWWHLKWLPMASRVFHSFIDPFTKPPSSPLLKSTGRAACVPIAHGPQRSISARKTVTASTHQTEGQASEEHGQGEENVGAPGGKTKLLRQVAVPLLETESAALH